MASMTLIAADIMLCWTGSCGVSRLFSGDVELNLTDNSRKHLRLSRSCWGTADLQMQRQFCTNVMSSIRAECKKKKKNLFKTINAKGRVK